MNLSGARGAADAAMSEGTAKFNRAQRAIGDSLPAIEGMVRDPRMRKALTDLVHAGRGVADELRRDGGRYAVKDAVRTKKLPHELDRSARMLRRMESKMARSRRRHRRRTIMSVVGTLGVLGAAGVGAARMLKGRKIGGGTDTSGNGFAHQSTASRSAETRPSGFPAPTH